MSEHLWPVRPEYLRRGTPVIDMSGRRLCIASIRPDQIVAVGHAPGSQGVMTTRGTGHGGGFALDLRDVTARAHAAWAWTEYDARGLAIRIAGRVRFYHTDFIDLPGDGVAMAQILCRMASGDPTVTVAEARTALEWAEGVSGE